MAVERRVIRIVVRAAVGIDPAEQVAAVIHPAGRRRVQPGEEAPVLQPHIGHQGAGVAEPVAGRADVGRGNFRGVHP